MMREDYAWAAGFYEGEGSIAHHCRNGRLYKPCEVRIVISQSGGGDAAKLLERFRDIVGCGKVYGPYTPSIHNLGKKPLWRFAVSKHEYVQAIAAMLWPWLSERRRTQIVTCLSKYNTSGSIGRYGDKRHRRAN
jgi:hypothetical protein